MVGLAQSWRVARVPAPVESSGAMPSAPPAAGPTRALWRRRVSIPPLPANGCFTVLGEWGTRFAGGATWQRVPSGSGRLWIGRLPRWHGAAGAANPDAGWQPGPTTQFTLRFRKTAGQRLKSGAGRRRQRVL